MLYEVITALRFAKGEQVISSTGVPARLIKPLDFLVVADHAENLGLAPMIVESDPELLKDPMGKKYLIELFDNRVFLRQKVGPLHIYCEVEGHVQA